MMGMKKGYYIYCFLLLVSLAKSDPYFDKRAQGLEQQADELGDYRGVKKEIVEEDMIYDGMFPGISHDEKSASFSSQALSSSALHRESRYDDHVLVKLKGLSPDAITALETQSGYDVWSARNDSAVLYLHRNHYLAMKQVMHLQSQDENLVVLNDHFQSLIDTETERLGSRRPFSAKSKPLDWFEDFHTFEETLQWYTMLQAEYPEFVQIIPSIGETAEGRSIFAVKIGQYHSGALSDTKPKKAIFLHALQHAREWISGSTVNYIAYHLIRLYFKMNKGQGLSHFVNDDAYRDGDDDPTLGLDAAALEKVEFIIVPVMNPDGYVYTWTTNRLWRKNRSHSAQDPFGRLAAGVDLNRNWEDHWGVTGSSSNPFSDVYMGPSPASELEVQAMQNVFLNHTNIIAAVDFHAYSQLLLWPYGYTTKLYQYHSEHRHIAKLMTKKIDAIHGHSFLAQRICDLYMASGNALDFWSGKRVFQAFGGRSPYAFAFELRPTMDDPRGFVLPPGEIVPAGQEVFSSVLEMTRQAIQNPLV